MLGVLPPRNRYGQIRVTMTIFQEGGTNISLFKWTWLANIDDNNKELPPDAVAKLREHRLPVWKVGSLIPTQLKKMTYKIDTCCYLAWNAALLG